MLERHFVSREFSCGIGILHKSIGFSGIVWCYVGVMWSEKCLFKGEKLGIGKVVVQSV